MIGETPHATDSAAEVPQVGDGLPEAAAVDSGVPDKTPREHGGRDGPEPTRYGDWEKNGRCIDF
jgi:hypothetical protein